MYSGRSPMRLLQMIWSLHSRPTSTTLYVSFGGVTTPKGYRQLLYRLKHLADSLMTNAHFITDLAWIPPLRIASHLLPSLLDRFVPHCERPMSALVKIVRVVMDDIFSAKHDA